MGMPASPEMERRPPTMSTCAPLFIAQALSEPAVADPQGILSHRQDSVRVRVARYLPSLKSVISFFSLRWLPRLLRIPVLGALASAFMKGATFMGDTMQIDKGDTMSGLTKALRDNQGLSGSFHGSMMNLWNELQKHNDKLRTRNFPDLKTGDTFSIRDIIPDSVRQAMHGKVFDGQGRLISAPAPVDPTPYHQFYADQLSNGSMFKPHPTLHSHSILGWLQDQIPYPFSVAVHHPLITLLVVVGIAAIAIGAIVLVKRYRSGALGRDYQRAAAFVRRLLTRPKKPPTEPAATPIPVTIRQTVDWQKSSAADWRYVARRSGIMTLILMGLMIPSAFIVAPLGAHPFFVIMVIGSFPLIQAPMEHYILKSQPIPGDRRWMSVTGAAMAFIGSVTAAGGLSKMGQRLSDTPVGKTLDLILNYRTWTLEDVLLVSVVFIIMAAGFVAMGFLYYSADPMDSRMTRAAFERPRGSKRVRWHRSAARVSVSERFLIADMLFLRDSIDAVVPKWLEQNPVDVGKQIGASARYAQLRQQFNSIRERAKRSRNADIQEWAGIFESVFMIAPRYDRGLAGEGLTRIQTATDLDRRMRYFEGILGADAGDIFDNGLQHSAAGVDLPIAPAAIFEHPWARLAEDLIRVMSALVRRPIALWTFRSRATVSA
jgi:hypothetical protein